MTPSQARDATSDPQLLTIARIRLKGRLSPVALFARLIHGLNRLARRQRIVRHEAEVDQSRGVAVAIGHYGSGGAVRDHSDFESPLQKLPHVGLDAEVGRHAAEDDPVDPALAKLKD